MYYYYFLLFVRVILRYNNITMCHYCPVETLAIVCVLHQSLWDQCFFLNCAIKVDPQKLSSLSVLSSQSLLSLLQIDSSAEVLHSVSKCLFVQWEAAAIFLCVFWMTLVEGQTSLWGRADRWTDTGDSETDTEYWGFSVVFHPPLLPAQKNHDAACGGKIKCQLGRKILFFL